MWCVIDTSKTEKTKQKQKAAENAKHKTKQTNKQAKKKHPAFLNTNFNATFSVCAFATTRKQSFRSVPQNQDHPTGRENSWKIPAKEAFFSNFTKEKKKKTIATGISQRPCWSGSYLILYKKLTGSNYFQWTPSSGCFHAQSIKK